MASLFDPLDDARRQALRERGYLPGKPLFDGSPTWRDPATGALVSEEDAFRRLEREEPNGEDKTP